MNLLNLFKRKKKAEPSEFDQLVKIVGSDVLSIWNGTTYNLTRPTKDENGDELPFKQKRWFKIRIGKFRSGRGDWGGGFEYATSSVAEVYIDRSGTIMHICAVMPFYNSYTRDADDLLYSKVKAFVDEYNAKHGTEDWCRRPMVTNTQDQWLRGALAVLSSVGNCNDEADFWQHCLSVAKPQ